MFEIQILIFGFLLSSAQEICWQRQELEPIRGREGIDFKPLFGVMRLILILVSRRNLQRKH
jgi:hypothetical protein